MNKSEFAAAGMHNQTTNCAQSVMNAFVDELGIDRVTALKLTLGFGGGMGHTGGTCGAVTAAVMVLGLRQSLDLANPKANRDEVYNLVQEFSRRFIQRHGSINCSQLLGYDLSTPAGAAAVKAKGLSASLCPTFVKSAVEILEEMAV
jgi:C_GCAxxG_C_C family probable redox protein